MTALTSLQNYGFALQPCGRTFLGRPLRAALTSLTHHGLASHFWGIPCGGCFSGTPFNDRSEVPKELWICIAPLGTAHWIRFS